MMLMRTKTVDFHYIEPGQKDIDAKLRNWRAWATPKMQSFVSPTWRMTRSNSRQWHAPEIRPTCDILGAMSMEKAVSKMAEPFRTVVRWYYVKGGSVNSICKLTGQSPAGVYKALMDARQILINVKA